MKINTDPKKIKELLERGVEEVIVKDHLERRLKKGERLRVKFGIDPTAPDLHLGHTVPLRKLKHFQDLGHQVILIVGDFTATIGDPSGRNELRKPLTSEEVKENMKNYLQQAAKIIDIKKAEVYYNSQWFKAEGVATFYSLTSKITVQRALERDDFQKRLQQKQEVSLIEVIYPLLQGYDSVKVKADVELGGTDQKFNLLMGRRIQRHYRQPEQDIMTLTLLEGIDGSQKMSKSLGNYIGITEPANEMYAKIMSVPDELIIKYFKLLTDYPLKEIEKMAEILKKEKDTTVNPRDLKVKLARIIVKMYHNEELAQNAEEEFDKVFKAKELPSKIPLVKLKSEKYPILDLLTEAKLTSSKSEAKRLIEQGAVEINRITEKNWRKEIKISKKGIIVQVGKRKFTKIIKE